MAEGVDGSSYSAPSSSINDIPTEVIDEILFFMDAKTLCRLRCTSRWWNVRISSPSFCLLHYNRSLHREWLLLEVCMKQRKCIDHYDHEYVFSSTNLAHPCNGNLWRFDLPDMTFIEVGESSAFGLLIMRISSRLCIYNPTTRSMVVDLPPCKNFGWSSGLALGLVHSTNQLKVVCLNIIHNSNNLECRVLTIPDDLSKEWRKVPIHPSVNSLNLMDVSSESAVYSTNFNDQQLFRFDLETELWSEVKLPSSIESFAISMAFRGSLCLVVEKAKFQCEVWLLQGDNVWVKKWVLNKCPNMPLFMPLHHDEERGKILMKNDYGMVRWYQIETGEYEEVHNFHMEIERGIVSYYISYVETLASFATLCDIVVTEH